MGIVEPEASSPYKYPAVQIRAKGIIGADKWAQRRDGEKISNFVSRIGIDEYSWKDDEMTLVNAAVEYTPAQNALIEKENKAGKTTTEVIGIAEPDELNIIEGKYPQLIPAGTIEEDGESFNTNAPFPTVNCANCHICHQTYYIKR